MTNPPELAQFLEDPTAENLGALRKVSPRITLWGWADAPKVDSQELERAMELMMDAVERQCVVEIMSIHDPFSPALCACIDCRWNRLRRR